MIVIDQKWGGDGAVFNAHPCRMYFWGSVADIDVRTTEKCLRLEVVSLNNRMGTKIRAFLKHVVAWAENEPGLIALALVGSQARGDAGPDSDVDLILLLRNPGDYRRNRNWVSEFGEPVHIVEEDWDKVTSLRVCYADGMEVEFGLANLAWGSDPGDEGDARVIKDGLMILHERDGHLSNKLKLFHGLSTPDWTMSED